MDEQETRRRRFAIRWMMIWLFTASLFLLGGGGPFPENALTDDFRALIAENVSPVLVNPINTFLESVDLAELPYLTMTSKIDGRASRWRILGGQGEAVVYLQKFDSPEIPDPVLPPVAEWPPGELKFTQINPEIGRPLIKLTEEEAKLLAAIQTQQAAPTAIPLPSETPIPSNTPSPSETPVTIAASTATLIPASGTPTLLPLWTATPTARPPKEDKEVVPVVNKPAPTAIPSNNPPTAVNDSATTLQNIPITIAVTFNDSDPDGDTLTTSAASGGSNGTLSVSGNNVTYTPNSGFTGNDSFSYTISDGNGGTATASVSVTVNP